MNLLTLLVGIEKDAEGKQLDPVRRAMAMKSLRRAAAQEFGGYTLTHCEGGWVNDAGALVAEGTLRVDAYTDHGRDACARFAERVRVMFGQGSVAMEFRAAPGLDFVTAPKSDNERLANIIF